MNEFTLGNKFQAGTNVTSTSSRIIADGTIEAYEPGSATYGSEYATSVAVNQDTMVVGAKGHSGTGAAFIYSRVNGDWVDEIYIAPNKAEVFMNFGHAVSIHGNRVAVGAPRDEWGFEGAGSVFIFEKIGNEWLQTHEILPSASSDNDSFGYAVVLFEDQLFVGAPTNYRVGGMGSAYHFNLNIPTSDWVEIDIIKPEVETEDSHFGVSIDFDSNRLLVGAPFADGSVAESGSAYAFEFNGSEWQETYKFIASDGLAEDWFGNDLSMSGDRVLIGAWGHDNLYPKAGAAYVFELEGSTWMETAKIEANDGNGWYEFGQAVDLVGNKLVVSAPRKQIGSTFEGAEGEVFLFEYNGTNWQETNQFISNNDFPNLFGGLFGFGTDIVLDNNEIYVGSPFDAPIGSSISSGVVHAYALNNSIWSETDLVAPENVLVTGFRGVAYDQNQLYVLVNFNETFYLKIYEKTGIDWVNVNQIPLSANCVFSNPFLSIDSEILENYMFIRGNNTNVCVFEKQNGIWNQIDSLQPSDIESVNLFGSAISASDNRIAISAQRNSTTSAARLGEVYIFEKINGDWLEVDKLIPLDQDGTFESFFGLFSVELLNDMLLVGSHVEGELAEVSGAVYVFEYDGTEWIESDKLTSADAATGDWFGSAISLNENLALIGAQRDDINGASNVGSVYVFQFINGAWVEATKLVANDGTAKDEFGSLVELKNNKILIGAQFDDTPNNQSGSSYLFENQNNQWTQVGKLLPLLSFPLNRFGQTAAIGNDVIFVKDHESMAIFSILPDLIFLNGFEVVSISSD